LIGLSNLEKNSQFPISGPANQFGFGVAGTVAAFGTGNKTLAPLELALFFARMKGEQPRHGVAAQRPTAPISLVVFPGNG
jgi:hypothetical protein